MADSTYTDAILSIIGGRARSMELGVSSAEQTAAGLLARAFVSARLSGSGAVLFTPERLSTMAWELVAGGQTIWRRDNGDLKWVPLTNISSRTGNYRIASRTYPPDRVLHARMNIDMKTGMGRSDLQMASATRDMIRDLENNLADEAHSQAGYLIPTVEWDNALLQEALQGLKGGGLMVPTMTSNLMGSPSSINSVDEWRQRRLGFEAPEVVRQWYESVRMAVLSIMGIPASLYSPADASAMREGWRLYIFTVVDPMSKLLEAAAARCGLELDMNFDRLMASDIANRARAFGQLVDGGMDENRAAELTGLE